MPDDNFIEQDKAWTEIWITHWIFFYKRTPKEIYEGIPQTEYLRVNKRNEPLEVVCKRIPVKYLLKEGLAYRRATKNMGDDRLFEKDKTTGLLKFKIVYVKYIDRINNQQ